MLSLFSNNESLHSTMANKTNYQGIILVTRSRGPKLFEPAVYSLEFNMAKGRRNSQRKKKNSKGNDEFDDENGDEGEHSTSKIPMWLMMVFYDMYPLQYIVFTTRWLWTS